MLKKSLFFLLLSFLGCTRIQTLNLEKHSYSERPNHVILIQVSGFSEEHIPLLRLNSAEMNYQTSLEKVSCMGKMWNYNLFSLRPIAFESFQSQILSTKNIKGNCEDYDNKPLWSYLNDLGYKTSLLENLALNDQSLEKVLDCKKGNQLNLDLLRIYRMGPEASDTQNHNAKFFHYQDSSSAIAEYLKPGLYFDKSCQKGMCYSSLSNNFKTLWMGLAKEQNQTFFLLRDNSFLRALKSKDLSAAKEALQEIDRIIFWVNSLKREDILILVTGAESMGIEYPAAGKEWADYERSGKNIFYKNSNLMSPVLAKGVMSENFCGIFEESELLKRIILKPERKIFNWEALLPFSN